MSRKGLRPGTGDSWSKLGTALAPLLEPEPKEDEHGTA